TVKDNGKGANLNWPIQPDSIGLGLVQELVNFYLDGELQPPCPANPDASSPGLLVTILFKPQVPQIPSIPDSKLIDQKRRVLLVEDDPQIGPSLKKLLCSESYAVLGSAVDKAGAIAYARHHAPSVIVMDVALGGGEYAGIEAAEAIRAFSQVPILFLTRHDRKDERLAKAREAVKPADYLSKTGFYHDHLLERVQSLIAQHYEPSTVFICYSHDRKAECEELVIALTPVMAAQSRLIPVELHQEPRGPLITWADKEQIKPGDRWFEKIMQALNRCSVGILLVDQAWLASPFIQQHEFPALLEQASHYPKFRLMPVLMEDCGLDDNHPVGRLLKPFQFVGGTFELPLDERGESEKRVTQRKKVWALISKEVAAIQRALSRTPADNLASPPAP
ncbi:MAG TPA: response regulator, partial [Prosthecobacter sp.]|nr:response regulator [Prosthecobacter sp.]